jgi:CRP-like cAMP-binding protein
MNASNLLLDAFARHGLARLYETLQPVHLAAGTVLADSGELPTSVYFPSGAVVSALVPMGDGRVTESHLTGRVGLAPLVAITGVPAPMRSVVTVAGPALRVDARTLADEVVREPELVRALVAFAHLGAATSCIAAACTRLHDVEERLATWLLSCRDHAGGDGLRVPDDALTRATGGRRALAGSATEALRSAGLVSVSSGLVSVVDVDGLARRACECYQRMRFETEAFAASLHA